MVGKREGRSIYTRKADATNPNGSKDKGKKRRRGHIERGK